jgi:hypothetical protein
MKLRELIEIIKSTEPYDFGELEVLVVLNDLSLGTVKELVLTWPDPRGDGPSVILRLEARMVDITDAVTVDR